MSRPLTTRPLTSRNGRRVVLVPLTQEELRDLIEGSRHSVPAELTKHLESYRPAPVPGVDPRD